MILLGVIFLNQKVFTFGGGAGQTAKGCSVTVSSAIIGDDLSATILSASGLRAWAVIQLVRDSAGVATSTAFVSFDEGAVATTNSFALSTTTPSVEFGLNTNFPYTGAVTGITNGTASTTIKVIECRY